MSEEDLTNYVRRNVVLALQYWLAQILRILLSTIQILLFVIFYILLLSASILCVCVRVRVCSITDSTRSKSNMNRIEEVITKLTSNQFTIIATQNTMTTKIDELLQKMAYLETSQHFPTFSSTNPHFSYVYLALYYEIDFGSTWNRLLSMFSTVETLHSSSPTSSHAILGNDIGTDINALRNQSEMKKIQVAQVKI